MIDINHQTLGHKQFHSKGIPMTQGMMATLNKKIFTSYV